MNENLVCRLCLQESKHLLNVFCNTLKEGNARHKIHKYLCIEIREDDSISKTVCLECLKKIEEFHSFYEQVAQNQERFRLLNPSQPEIVYTTLEKIPDITNITINCGDLVFQEDNRILLEVKHESIRETARTVQFHIQDTSPNEDQNAFDNYTYIRRDEPPLKQDHDLNESNLNEDTNSSLDDDGSQSDIDANEYHDKFLQNEVQTFNEDIFPKVLIKDEKFIIHGKQLVNLISKFYKLSCDLCPESITNQDFDSLGSLFSHYKQMHLIKGYVICCGIKLMKLRRMALHMARHIQPGAFKCPECGKMMTSPKILRYHIQNHLPEEERPLSCPQCPRRFSYGSALVAHQISHLPLEQRDSHICDECGKTFLTSARLSKHINSSHIANGQLFICHTCGKQFSCKGNFNYHLATHEKFHQVQCEICKKWLKNKLCLRKHMTQHSAIRHNCPECNYSTVNRQCLQNHMRVRHSNEKPFTCEECGRDFKLKNTLINHMVQHTGERRYTCEFCSKQFASSGNYYAHRKRMHPTELAEVNKKKEEELRLYREMSLEKKSVTN